MKTCHICQKPITKGQRYFNGPYGRGPAKHRECSGRKPPIEKPHFVEVTYYTQVFSEGKWRFYGSRNRLEDAVKWTEELRADGYDTIRLVEDRRTQAIVNLPTSAKCCENCGIIINNVAEIQSRPDLAWECVACNHTLNLSNREVSREVGSTGSSIQP